MAEPLPLSSIDTGDVENLLDDAFGTDRQMRTAYLLRKGVQPITHLSFAIVEGDALVGSIQCWPVALDETPLILVGPVAVATANQNRGLGHRLMHAALDAETSGDAPMVMIGDPEYYGRFGFNADATGGWTLPGPWEPRRLLLRNSNNFSLPHKGLLGPRL
jgi:predicted N-acetyltransferase YhbS